MVSVNIFSAVERTDPSPAGHGDSQFQFMDRVAGPGPDRGLVLPAQFGRPGGRSVDSCAQEMTGSPRGIEPTEPRLAEATSQPI